MADAGTRPLGRHSLTGSVMQSTGWEVHDDAVDDGGPLLNIYLYDADSGWVFSVSLPHANLPYLDALHSDLGASLDDVCSSLGQCMADLQRDGGNRQIRQTACVLAYLYIRRTKTWAAMDPHAAKAHFIVVHYPRLGLLRPAAFLSDFRTPLPPHLLNPALASVVAAGVPAGLKRNAAD